MDGSNVVWKMKGLFKADAQIVASELKSIQTENNEEVKPKDIVNYAETHEDSELHKCFTWDDTEAAKRYRIEEAKMIVRNIMVIYSEPTKKEEPRQVQVRWAFKTEPTGGYKRTEYIVKNPDEHEKLLNMAKAELESFRRKYEILSNDVLMREIFEAIDKIV